MRVKTNISPAAILRSRGLGDSDRARVFLANEVARLSDPYVPMRQGTLKNTREIAGDGRTVTYPQPYAHYQYTGEVMAGRAPKHYTGKALTYHGAPMRGPNWNKRMLADRKGDLTQSVARFTGGRPK
ncbi:MAG TPA: minor capsid protein [Candidatus Agathobaculum merdigallinarum]|nr:minor capsid protein [Candidatus Agathobaculum merdigallinarum]